MQHKRPPVPVIVVLLLVLLVGGYYGLQALFDEKMANSRLLARSKLWMSAFRRRWPEK